MNISVPAELQQWADGPYPLIETPKHKEGKTASTDPYMETASTMCVIHNALLRGLNSIYVQGPNIQPPEYMDFIGYSLCWHSVVHEHHTSEEDQFFPEIEEAVGEKGLLDGNIQQHRSFQSGLDEFSDYLKGLAGKEASFDALQLNDIISSFAPALCDHLSSEIQSLLALSKYGDKLPIEDFWSREGKRTVVTPKMSKFRVSSRRPYQTAMTKFSALPFFFLNLDVTHEDYLWKDWPPIPSLVKWVITYCFTLWHMGYWKFASCDRSGTPKPLYALDPHR